MLKFLVLLVSCFSSVACSATSQDPIDHTEEGQTIDDGNGPVECPTGSTKLVTPRAPTVDICHDSLGASSPARCAMCGSDGIHCVSTCHSSATQCVIRIHNNQCLSPGYLNTSYVCKPAENA